MEDDEQKNLKKMEEFYTADFNIKKLIVDMSPKEDNLYSEESRMEYVNRFLEKLEEIKMEFTRIIRTFNFSSNMGSYIEEKVSECKRRLTKCNYDVNKLVRIYQECISEISDEVKQNVREECVGYSECGFPIEIIEECNTINEILDVFHSFVTNNDMYLQALPKIDEKKNENGFPITLRGEKSELARQIFDVIPLDMDIENTDIVALNKNDRIIMMIRNKAHALSIEIDTSEDDVWVNYFIPKLCNLEMIKNLRGINNIDPMSMTAMGRYRTDRRELATGIAEFIGDVPSDSEMSPIDVKNLFNEMTKGEPEQEKRFDEESIKKLAESRNMLNIQQLIDTFKERMGKLFERRKGYDR